MPVSGKSPWARSRLCSARRTRSTASPNLPRFRRSAWYTAYIEGWQALPYMIGELKIIELRDRARAALGERFDIRRFHMAVLDTGPVPLSVLDKTIDDWVAAEKARSP